MVELVRRTVAEVLGYDSADEVEVDVPFGEQGVDSLLALDIRERIAAELGVALPPTIVFEAPTPALAAEYLDRVLSEAGSDDDVVVEVAPAADDPVVIVGMACRLPGGIDTVEGFWQLLLDEDEVIGPLPDDRGWDVEGTYDPDPDTPGSIYVRGGGFLQRVQDFDAGFFGISPREAIGMDPQQRLLLEVSWEALERAGIDPVSLRGTETGVYAGLFSSGYASVLAPVFDEVEGYLSMGTLTGVAAGRVAYALGLQGPAMSVDTACSSSLVTLHLAAQALHAGECDVALAGGVTVLADLTMHIEFCRERALSVDGRCRPFAEGADGFGPSEGAGMLVLQRMSDAVRQNRKVLAVVRGSAVNQDGASNGLSAPNGAAQQRVIRKALRNASLGPADVDIIEAHGTGTPLGDPIEAGALLATYGRRPADQPALVGSAKSNVGHTQAAAGVVGVIKAVLAMQHGVVPRSLHSDTPSSMVDWSAGAVTLADRTVAWPDRGRARRAAVSGFGVSGTNAHVILEQAPQAARSADAAADGPAVWTFAAKSPSALRAYAGKLRHFAEKVDDPAAAGRALVESRSAFAHRAVVFAADRAELVRGLASVAGGVADSRVVVGRVRTGPGPVFVFPGQGAQWPEMARDLLASAPVFARWISECERAFAPYVDWSLTAALRDGVDLSRVDVVQPALFAVLVGLARLWEHHGVLPSAVVGHSQGEIAAAYVAGALTLDDAARVVTLRSREIVALTGLGGMAAVMLGRAEVEHRLSPYGDALALAAVNGPAAMVVSGEVEALEKLLAELTADGVWSRRIDVDYASHSAAVDAIEAEVRAVLAPIRPQSSKITFVSTVTAGAVDTEGLDAGYWYRNLRSAVRFEEAIEFLRASGHRKFVEISPHPVLSTALNQIDDTAFVMHSQHRERTTPADFAMQVGVAHANGIDVDWATLLPPSPASFVDLPTYPFERAEYWPSAPVRRRMVTPVVTNALTGQTILSGVIGLSTHPWLADHAVRDVVVFPGAGFVDLALQAAQSVGLSGVGEFTIAAPLVLGEDTRHELQVIVGAEAGDTVEICARAEGEVDQPWVRHAAGVLIEAVRSTESAGMRPTGAETVDLQSLYGEAEQHGYHYGPAFQRLTGAWRDGGTTYANVALDPSQAGEAQYHALHPALLDACMHPMVATTAETVLPFLWDGVQLLASAATSLHVQLRQVADGELTLVATDPDGHLVLSVDRLLVRPVAADALSRVPGGLFELGWEPVVGPLPAQAAPVLNVSTDEKALPHQDVEAGSVLVLTCPPAAGPVADEVERITADVLRAVRNWLAEDRFAGTSLVVATENAVDTGGDVVAGLAHAPVWGLVRSAQTEHPDRTIVLLDLDGVTPLDDVVQEVVAAGAPQLAVRGGDLLAPKLIRASAPRQEPLDLDGTVLITGGLGTLGTRVAAHLVRQHGIRHLLLVGRRMPDDATLIVDELAELGAEVRVATCDVADREAVAALLDTVQPPLSGVVHTAGVIDDGMLADLDAERLHRVMAPKVRGAWNLHELTAEVPLFVSFSSASGVLGSPGQANYAAANTFLDALAAHRRALGQHGQSLAWGLWDEASGMTGHLDEAALRRLRRLGVVPMTTSYGLDLLDAAIGRSSALTVTARFDLAGADKETVPPLLRGLLPRTALRRAATATKPPVPLASVPPQQRRTVVLELVRASIAQICGYPAIDDVPEDKGLRELGVDSLSGVELRNRLNAATGLHLPVTLVFDHPTPAALADGVLLALDGGPTAPDRPETVRAAPLLTDEELFAFVDDTTVGRADG
ncbi:Acyl transferase domain-containing protein [Lentzea xinjiangensis]|uniref:Acyl transferase domain-containing protein n=1 Tax=Lentzea xinjiangensis TaxID=402600 RepID=A0A1H9NJI7_9PSEU|nr:type I polyketide synthase [Lentzea xinjiangensis]SER36130.1 Acyl transferase domain-containing protein [Lentzea xinjiangensis]